MITDLKYVIAFIALNNILLISCTFPNPTDKFINSVVLSPDIYKLHWNATDKEIIFEIHSKNSNGWTGFGLSPTGGMKNADLVAFWMDSAGKSNFTDRHCDGDGKVLMDEKQDWILIKMMQQNDYLITQFKRPLLICDSNMPKQDIDITEGNFHIIFSYGQLNQNDIQYHGTNQRGSKNIYLLGNSNQKVDLNMNKTQVYSFSVEVYIDFS
jgi:hypothetical protein